MNGNLLNWIAWMLGSRIDTQFIGVVSDQVAVDEPGVDAGVIGHEAGHSAAHQCTITTDHVLHVDVRLVQLVHHCLRCPFMYASVSSQ